MWKRLSEWSYEELEDELLRQPAREQLLFDDKRRRKKEIRKKYRRSRKTGKSKTSCDRLAILHRGQFLAEGPLEELRDQHHQRDLEELFFQLISRHDEAHPA